MAEPCRKPSPNRTARQPTALRVIVPSIASIMPGASLTRLQVLTATRRTLNPFAPATNPASSSARAMRSPPPPRRSPSRSAAPPARRILLAIFPHPRCQELRQRPRHLAALRLLFRQPHLHSGFPAADTRPARHRTGRLSRRHCGSGKTRIPARRPPQQCAVRIRGIGRRQHQHLALLPRPRAPSRRRAPQQIHRRRHSELRRAQIRGKVPPPHLARFPPSPSARRTPRRTHPPVPRHAPSRETPRRIASATAAPPHGSTAVALRPSANAAAFSDHRPCAAGGVVRRERKPGVCSCTACACFVLSRRAVGPQRMERVVGQ